MSTIVHPEPALIQVLVEGNVAQAVYIPQLAESFILPSFCKTKNLLHHLGVCNSTITVKIHTGEYFTCSMKLKISTEFITHTALFLVVTGLICARLVYRINLKLRYACLKVSLSHPSQWLFFAPSPFNAIRTQLCSKEIYHDDNVQFQVASSVHDIKSDFGDATSSAANRSRYLYYSCRDRLVNHDYAKLRCTISFL